MSKSGIIVTGASGLIGSKLSNHLEAIGHKVVRVDVVKSAEHETFVCDLTDEYEVSRMCDLYCDFDTLVNCFAHNDHVRPGEKRGTVLDLSTDAFKAMMDVNVSALFVVCREFARIRLGYGGNIVNIGASTGIVAARTDMYGGAHKNIGYSTSKAAVIHMTKILGTHLAALDQNMRVNCISPGGLEADQDEAFKSLYGSHTPSGRMGRVEELFPIVEMLIDDKNTYMVGANIVVDGGWTIQ